MRFGLAHLNVIGGGEASVATRLGRAAEDGGVDSVWVVDHVTWPTGFASTYPYGGNGALPPVGSPFPEPLTWLAYLAAVTSSVKLATGILVLPQRQPLLVAKQVATVDVLSGGRVLLGVGVGWLREEFEQMGAEWERRAARTDAYIEAMRAVWSQDEASFEGEGVRFRGARVVPHPTNGAVPIVIGGGEAGARRAGRLGDGYYPSPNASIDELRHLLRVMADEAAACGRDVADIEVTARGELDAESIEPLIELGVDRVLISAVAGDLADVDGTADRIDRLVEDVIPIYGSGDGAIGRVGMEERHPVGVGEAAGKDGSVR